MTARFQGLQSLPNKLAAFVEPMECEAVSELRGGPQWVYQIKLDGYRAIAVKSDNKVRLFSRRQKSFNKQYPYIVEALVDLPDGTVIDGEIVALDDSARPQFNLLQNYRSEARRIRYFVFDLLCYDNRDTTCLPLVERRTLLRTLKFQSSRIQFLEYLETSATNMVAAAKDQRLEGVVGKRRDSLYQPGRRTGSWVKYRISVGQEFVVGGYFPGPHGFDSIIVGYYEGRDLMYAARTRSGFVPASRRQVFSKLKHLVTASCPFVNLPETRRSRFGEELNAEKMKKAVWLRPEAVAQIEFLEWTEADRLRHSKFVGLREDKNPRSVVKEHVGEAASD
jgi:bifunctional non-homologous end joining protein LigD